MVFHRRGAIAAITATIARTEMMRLTLVLPPSVPGNPLNGLLGLYKENYDAPS